MRERACRLTNGLRFQCETVNNFNALSVVFQACRPVFRRFFQIFVDIFPLGAVFGVSAVVERGERRSTAGFAEQKPKEKRAAEKARNDADRKNAREENDSRKRVANGEKKRAAEKRRRDQTSGVASDAKASDVRNGQPDETDRPAKSDDDGDERA